MASPVTKTNLQVPEAVGNEIAWLRLVSRLEVHQLQMWRQGQNLLRRASLLNHSCGIRQIITGSTSSASPSVSIWRRKKEMGKEGLMVAKELKRLQSNAVRFEKFMKSHVSRLLKSDLVAVLAEFQRQDLPYLSMRVTI